MHISVVESYEDACLALDRWGMLPLSSFIPDHPSLEALTRPEAWHTGQETDPWLWRDRVAGEGMGAYGRFIAGKPLLVAREIFPLVQSLLRPAQPVEERYAAGILGRATLRVYEIIAEHPGIDVKALRKGAEMQQKADKNEFDRALNDLQSTGEVVITGISGRLNEHGNKSGWNSTCYALSEWWMEQHKLAPLEETSAEAKQQFFAWIATRWQENAIAFLRKKLH